MATVLFKRKTATEISSLPIEDGSLIFNTTDKDILMDNGTERERYGGGNLSTTDIVNDVATAIAVTETDVPAGCGTIKELNSSLTFSDTESVCGTFNGELLYRKAFNLKNVAPNTSGTIFDSTLTPSTIIPIHMYGILQSCSNTNCYPLPYANTNQQIRLLCTENGFCCDNFSQLATSANIIVTIEYIKK